MALIFTARLRVYAWPSLRRAASAAARPRPPGPAAGRLWGPAGCASIG